MKPGSPLAAALVAALLAAAPAAAQAPEAVAALKALASDPSAPQPASLAGYGFIEATYLVDGLTRGEIRALQGALESRRLTLPANVANAVNSRRMNARAIGPGNGGGRD